MIYHTIARDVTLGLLCLNISIMVVRTISEPTWERRLSSALAAVMGLMVLCVVWFRW